MNIADTPNELKDQLTPADPLQTEENLMPETEQLDQPLIFTQGRFLAAATVIILLIIGSVYYYLSMSAVQHDDPPVPAEYLTSPSPSATPKPVSYPYASNLFSEVEAIFTRYAEGYGAKMMVPSYPAMTWVNSDGYDIEIKNPPQVKMGLDCSNTYLSADNQILINKEKIKKELGAEIDTLMASQGFTKSESNTSKSLTDDQFYDYIQGYENEELKCLYLANPDCYGLSEATMYYEYYFFCANDLESNENEQLPFVKDLDLRGQTIQVNKMTDNFAQLSVNGRRTGFVLIAKKIDGRWTKVFAGQDAIDCASAEEHGVPEEIYGSCYR